ncbi:hypothetical protein [Methanoregula formicica]|uniref:Transposase n=1 Tax=Methanoregula formicica (strain DSM 22288 / NBRC 105244 / SMSP) TaxID=593750 RepID=L0HD57_METFS|nr:hypothetical protein [Methanoregula formicica]AGB01706.1 hypothetical protein Metfor_0646 [Methanoregula formicica SMSP]
MRLRQVPAMLVNIIHTALVACEDVRFHAGTACPFCGGRLSGYDERRKRFAVLVEDENRVVVNVVVCRSYCRVCERIIDPPQPFYPGTRIGAPVVDLCRTLSSNIPFTRASVYLERMGVIVDRWSVRHYSGLALPVIPSVDVFGMKIPVSIISLSTFAGTSAEPASLDMEEILMVCNIARSPPPAGFPARDGERKDPARRP